MHVQIVNFQLDGITEEEFRNICNEVAPAFAELPGLMTKVWLADSASGTYGGVYLWESRNAMEEFQASELFRTVAEHPHLAGITSSDFAVLEGPTEVTWRLGIAVPA
jgi:heme-degrading monooxygenase HmoA